MVSLLASPCSHTWCALVKMRNWNSNQGGVSAVQVLKWRSMAHAEGMGDTAATVVLGRQHHVVDNQVLEELTVDTQGHVAVGFRDSEIDDNLDFDPCERCQGILGCLLLGLEPDVYLKLWREVREATLRSPLTEHGRCSTCDGPSRNVSACMQQPGCPSGGVLPARNHSGRDILPREGVWDRRDRISTRALGSHPHGQGAAQANGAVFPPLRSWDTPVYCKQHLNSGDYQSHRGTRETIGYQAGIAGDKHCQSLVRKAEGCHGTLAASRAVNRVGSSAPQRTGGA
ncbi:uncharacterized protein BO66DRAFT_231659 [Aspergillus aculeatinus CBS 121060]|uniref:Uncharacterized protein n=1 Tax=Aspergillus aculeatinus CBS 121060 TaxID=1448322 RepID=A0ACD1GU93_9EURO|nr:hypothetical protein BO66DRAFT_231659 [Aspergillus aculeatinus CBS 121060]RAH64742.1 hypothetical protein BO66DRAFT_231659 [Aspergillus aculeatinus CBS 121060]